MTNNFYYKYDWQKKSFCSCSLSHEIKNKMDSLGSELLSIYLEQQEGKLGIERLGKFIRANDKINKIFSIDGGIELVKCFENRRSFPKIFLDSYSHNVDNIYFITLEEQFGKASEMVDKSFIRMSDITSHINKLISVFNPIMHKNIYLIEIESFKNFSIIKDGKWTRIERVI